MRGNPIINVSTPAACNHSQYNFPAWWNAANAYLLAPFRRNQVATGEIEIYTGEEAGIEDQDDEPDDEADVRAQSADEIHYCDKAQEDEEEALSMNQHSVFHNRLMSRKYWEGIDSPEVARNSGVV